MASFLNLMAYMYITPFQSWECVPLADGRVVVASNCVLTYTIHFLCHSAHFVSHYSGFSSALAL